MWSWQEIATFSRYYPLPQNIVEDVLYWCYGFTDFRSG